MWGWFGVTAALAVTCFVKVFAMGFLGMSRSAQAERAKEARRSALVPMALLSLLCLGLGILPTYVIPVLGRAVAPLAESAVVEALVRRFFRVARITSDCRLSLRPNSTI